MKLWLSAEVQQDVSDALRHAETKIKRAINPRLGDDYGPNIEEWAIITILRPKVPDGWGEVYRYHHDRRVAEFRLIINHDEFKAANPEGQIVMLWRSILRSLELFPAMGVGGFDLDRFRQDIVAAATSEGWAIAK